eukprot:SAG31_NODE_37635_length_302_cov_1.305419_2_plen_36_part_01
MTKSSAPVHGTLQRKVTKVTIYWSHHNLVTVQIDSL